MVISHDRYFLDRVVSRILEVEHAGVVSYRGNYAEYQRQKGIRQLEQQRAYEQQQAYIEKQQAYIRRYAAGQRAREARGRRTRLERFLKTERIEKPVIQKPAANIRIVPKRASGHLVVSAAGISKRFGSTTLFGDLSFEITRGERIGVLGPNGAGKTTLLRMIVGEALPDEGELKCGERLDIGYHEQDLRGMDASKKIIDELWAVCPTATENELRSFLARFLFRNDDVFKTVGELSGGEQARLKLAKLLYSRPNFLVLDEPTNHLDIASRCALEEALEVYDGTLLVVSHDRYLLDRLVRKLLIVDSGRAELQWGNYSDYRARREAQTDQQTQTKQTRRRPKRSPRAQPKEQLDSRVRAYERQLRTLTLDAVEDLIEEREKALAEFEDEFSVPELYKDHTKYLALRQNYETVKEELDILMQVWERRAER